ncbi:hypothetical protein K501DRAFT_303199 [Backusella circina FSU 941]|nr:hypothetical protein K501DRAFT_303199 [Backusella circina FSU 941]
MPSISQLYNSSIWKSKDLNYYVWCRVVSLSLNFIYIIRTSEWTYDAGYSLIVHPESQSKYIIPLEEGVKLLLGCVMLFCLVVDLVILTTSKLSIADWYWKSGIFFFFLTIGNQSVSLADQFFGSDVQLQICQKRLSSIQVQASIITELCGLNIRINYVNTIVSLFRDVFVCVSSLSILL